MQAQINKQAPQFTCQAYVDGKFQKVSLSDYKGQYVVLFFYPFDFTFVCPTEICNFNDASDEFKKIGCQVLACSIDSHFVHMQWSNTPRKEGGLGPMKIPMLADVNKSIAEAYGCLIQDGDAQGAAYRATYIIDKEQKLRHLSIQDLPVGRNPDEYLRLVQAFQYTDENGEVCPAKWKPGSKTIKPSVEQSKEYFNSAN
ncbi:Thioredoxin-like fold [Pseudocohnilembus persalinus]|uniref:thioredoxin-dependent peroxiredoxin n=1 Tax=Pseudocohnilembus persalinus TaxID=266149 RepID=A0A0V0QM03_PSEPJ|nr:Thioredoxin-like fold [Pseudocohnilembus persalinus]|eukprot:KRX03024.1 Thioredoxin-like fold [Pseudocohnilembus persalinus]